MTTRYKIEMTIEYDTPPIAAPCSVEGMLGRILAVEGKTNRGVRVVGTVQATLVEPNDCPLCLGEGKTHEPV